MQKGPAKKDLLREEIKHIDLASLENAVSFVKSSRDMAFTARDSARAAEIYDKMICDPDCSVFLTLAGSTSAGGCMNIYSDLVRYNMVDAVVATGASIVDMDFFEALGFKHYKGTPNLDDNLLRRLKIDRIYDTFIDEDQLQECDMAVRKIADSLKPRPYSSRGFIKEMGKWLSKNSAKKNSLVQVAYENDVPIFCPAFSDSSAGFGLVKHQLDRIRKKKAHLTIDSVADFRELTEVKMASKSSGLLMIGGGVPKNFVQDTVVCAEVSYGKDVPMHKYAIQVTVADVRDGGCSSSTLKEAASWGKVDTAYEQMVYAEATSVIPMITAYAFRMGGWEMRPKRKFSKLFD